MPNILNEIDSDLLIEEIVNDKIFEKLEREIETFETKDETKYPQNYKSDCLIFINIVELNELDKKILQALFRRSRHNYMSILTFSQEYCKLPKKLLELIESYVKFSNQTFSEMFRIPINTRHQWS